MDDLPPPAYEYTPQELDVKLSHAIQRSLAINDPSRSGTDGYEIWNDDAHNQAAQQMRHYASQRPQSSSSYQPFSQPSTHSGYPRDEKRRAPPRSPPPPHAPAAPAYPAAGGSRNSGIGLPASSSSSSVPVPAYVPSGAYRPRDEKRGFPADPPPVSPAAPAYSATPAYSPPPPAPAPAPAGPAPVRPLNVAKKPSPPNLNSSPNHVMSQPQPDYRHGPPPPHPQHQQQQPPTPSRPLPQYQAPPRPPGQQPPYTQTQPPLQPYQAKHKQPMPESKQRPNWLDPPPPHPGNLDTHVPPRPNSTDSSSSVNESPTDDMPPPPFMSPRASHMPPQPAQRPLNVLQPPYNPRQSQVQQPQRRTPEPRTGVGAALYSSAMAPAHARNGLIARAQSQQPILGSKLTFDNNVAYKSPFGSMPTREADEETRGSLYSSAVSSLTSNRFSVAPSRSNARPSSAGAGASRGLPDRRLTGGYAAPAVPNDVPPVPPLPPLPNFQNQMSTIHSPPPQLQQFPQQSAPPSGMGQTDLHRRQSFYPPGAAPPIQPQLGHPASALPDLPTSPPPPPHPIPPPPPHAIPVRQQTYGGPLGGQPHAYQTPPPPPAPIPISPANQTSFGYQSQPMGGGGPAMPGFFAQPGPDMYASLQQESMQQSVGTFFPAGSGFR